MDNTHLIQKSLKDIKDLHGRFEQYIAGATARLSVSEQANDQEELRFSSVYWREVAYRNAAIKLKLIIEQNFRYLETLSLLATARYTFEIVVWLKLLEADERYGLRFYYEVIRLSIQHCEEQIRKVETEIKLFERLDHDEDQMTETAIGTTATASVNQFIMDEIDRRARREFSIYADQAKTNGYGFQAYLMREQVLPQLRDALAAAVQEREKFWAGCSVEARKISKTRWKWQEQSRKANMQNQYDFIYSYTSRLLHATPASFCTDQKNLEFAEIQIFLEYIYVSFLDAIEITEKTVGGGVRH